ncbi:MAG: TIM44-like domain-containing protein [Streptosporangiaceae bacterium]
MSNWRKLILALVCAGFILTPSLADARAGGSARAGGGMGYSSQGSMGSRSYGYNGAQPLNRSLTPQSQSSSPYYGGRSSFAQSHPFLTGLGGAFLGSWIGSMLFPHWGMGYGYGGGVFGSLFSWLLIIGIIWFGFRLFRRRGAPLTMPDFGGMNYGTPQTAYPHGSGAGRSGVALTVTEADYAAFEAILKAVQAAWSKGDIRALGHYVTPEMLSYFGEELAGNTSQGVENHVEQVELINGDVREAWDEGALQYATALLHWRAVDYTVRSDRQPGQPGYRAEGDPQRPSEAQEMWTFARSPGGHWLLSAIQQV